MLEAKVLRLEAKSTHTSICKFLDSLSNQFYGNWTELGLYLTAN